MKNKHNETAAVIMAAGKGTRLGSDVPKPAQLIAGKPMLRWIVEALQELLTGPLVVVVPPDEELAKVVSDAAGPGVMTTPQQDVVGTGSALLAAERLLGRFHGDLIVTVGDSPAMRKEDFAELLEHHRGKEATVTFATGEYDPTPPYGRVIRDEQGKLVKLIEDRDATPVQRQIREVVTSQWVFRSPLIWPLLHQIRMAPVTKEMQLTDVVGIAANTGLDVSAWLSPRPERLTGVNTPEEFKAMESFLAGSPRLDVATHEHGFEHVE